MAVDVEEKQSLEDANAKLTARKGVVDDSFHGVIDEQIEKILGTQDQALASSYGAQDKNGNFTTFRKNVNRR